MSEFTKNNEQEGIAIIGMAGRFPDAPNIETFWRNLSEGQESITFFADDELDDFVPSALRSKKDYIKARGVLDDADKFDARFFGIAPREAEVMDPQQRVFLEVAWEALEHAGYVPDKYDGIIGVYAGSGENTYFVNHVLANPHIAELIGEHQTSLLNSPDYLSTRVSYKLNLTGPSVSLYTGCSTSLVAVCHGFDSLMSYQSDIILAGGSFIWCPQNRGYLYHPGSILSADGHCRPFDEDAQGTVFSSGVGVVVLKRLADALSDNDQIYAIIRGTGLNNDGSDKVSFAAPSVSGQAAVVAMAQATAGIESEYVTYIEAHGTGTPIGDPIEITALRQVFRAYTEKNSFCAIGSVKSNIGHLDAAAGVAGLIKTVLSLHHKQIPPTIHFKRPNPALELENSPFYVNNNLIEWKTDKQPRMAGVSSFGVGGTNAHIILEEAPECEFSHPTRPWQLLLISAKTKKALEASTNNLVTYLKENQHTDLGDMAYTLKVGRKDLEHRRMAVCSDTSDAVSQLEIPSPGLYAKTSNEAGTNEVVFMFPGQGAQYVNMGLELYESEKTFQQIVDDSANFLEPAIGVNLRDILYPQKPDITEAERKLKQTVYTQPLLFIIEYALARLWIEWGIKPAAMIGHSIGEYVAACLSGVFSLNDALSLIAARGQLVQQLPEGAMLAVFLTEQELAPYLGSTLSLGSINAPSICVVSGETQEIQDLQARLTSKQIHYRILETSHAFHSHMMDPILDQFSSEVADAKRSAPKIPFISNVTGTWISSQEAQDPGYWSKHLRNTVRFSNGMGQLLKQGYRIYLEVGPGNTANILARQQPSLTNEHIVLSSARHPKERKSDMFVIVETLGKLWLAGLEPNWNAFYENEKRRRVPLPTYPFERNRYWLPAGKKKTEIVQQKPLADNLPDNFMEPVDLIEIEHHPKANVNHQKAPEKVELILSEMWSNILGIHDVPMDDNFFDLGGSSLLAVSMFTKLEELFYKKLPIATLYKAPTIRKLAQLLISENTNGQWRSLVPIQSEGKKPPLFLVHGAGGNVLIYRELANRLAPDQPVYGLQAKGLSGKETAFARIEDMASYYLDEVLEMQPEGPYLLGGYCMGGTVAMEMAQQLSAMGKQVSNLIFFETYNFSKIPPQSSMDKINYYLQKIDFHLRNFLLLDSNNKKKFFKEKSRVARARKEVWAGLLLSKFGHHISSNNNNGNALYQLWETNDRAADNYVPKPYNGRITHFMPLKEYTHHLGPDLMWDKIALGTIKKITLPVYPAGMIVEPFVPLLAKELKKCINESL